MRLTEHEISAIKETAAKWFGADAEVRLFGSRAINATSGGDIDIYILTGSKDKANLRAEMAFNVELQQRIGEQKIDVIVRARGTPRQAIDFVATETGVIL